MENGAAGEFRWILDGYQARKTGKQKDSFLERLRSDVPEMRIEEGRYIVKCRNVVIGDPDSAEYVISAHYDTCSRIIIPNLQFIDRPLLTYLITFIMFIPFFAVETAVSLLAAYLWENMGYDGLLGMNIASAVCYTLLICSIFFGIPSRTTANDNTSGVTAVLRLYRNMSPELRDKCAFVLFDNEELGLLGSRAFRKQHKEAQKRFTLINMDCISDGDDIMLTLSGGLRQAGDEDNVREAFAAEGKNTVILHEGSAMCSSDHRGYMNFIGIAVAHHCFLGHFTPRLHTKRDTVFDEHDLDVIIEGVQRYIAGKEER